MAWADCCNGAFEVLGTLFVALNIRRILRDKSISGVSILPTAFFAAWGYWNMYYYPSLGQWMSFIGGIGVAVCNTTWVVLACYYRKAKADEGDA